MAVAVTGVGEETTKKKESKVEAVSVELVESCSELPQERDSQAEGDDCVKSDDDDDDKLSTESLTSKEKSAAEPEMEKQPLEEVAIEQLHKRTLRRTIHSSRNTKKWKIHQKTIH